MFTISFSSFDIREYSFLLNLRNIGETLEQLMILKIASFLCNHFLTANENFVLLLLLCWPYVYALNFPLRLSLELYFLDVIIVSFVDELIVWLNHSFKILSIRFIS